MLKNKLYATAFFEIGEQVYDENGVVHTVTDILLCHYVGRGTYKVLYELDNSKEFIDLRFQGLDDQTTRKHTKQQKPTLTLAGTKNAAKTEKPCGEQEPGTSASNVAE